MGHIYKYKIAHCVILCLAAHSITCWLFHVAIDGSINVVWDDGCGAGEAM